MNFYVKCASSEKSIYQVLINEAASHHRYKMGYSYEIIRERQFCAIRFSSASPPTTLLAEHLIYSNLNIVISENDGAPATQPASEAISVRVRRRLLSI